MMKVSILKLPVGFMLKGIKTLGIIKLRGFETFGQKGIANGLLSVMMLLITVQVIKLLKSWACKS